MAYAKDKYCFSGSTLAFYFAGLGAVILFSGSRRRSKCKTRVKGMLTERGFSEGEAAQGAAEVCK